MSKALVIKGASFSTNKVETITLDGGGSVPCTALELSQSTIAFTALGATQTLTATKTPSNTTDELTWASSDASVATVADGVVTAVGIGTATITATCGEQTATCSVSLSSVVMNMADYTVMNGLKAMINTSGRDYASPDTSSPTRYRAYFSGTNVLNGYKALYKSGTTDYDEKFPIPLPPNASSVTITYGAQSQDFGSAYLTFMNADEEATYFSNMNTAKAYGGDSTQAKFLGALTTTVDLSGLDSAVDSFILCMNTKSGVTDEQATGTITLTFS